MVLTRSGLLGEPSIGGSYPMILMGRTGRGAPNDDLNNPQNQGFLRLIDSAQSDLRVESPNINDDHFRGAVVAAALRGVRVSAITSFLFNESSQSTPFVGGGNENAIQRLRQSQAAFRGNPANLRVCWYSRKRSSTTDW
jgi:hypothetical protein